MGETPGIVLNAVCIPQCSSPVLHPEPHANDWGVPGKWMFSCGLAITTSFASGRATGRHAQMIADCHNRHHADEHKLRRGGKDWGMAIESDGDRVADVVCGWECSQSDREPPYWYEDPDEDPSPVAKRLNRGRR